MADTITKSLFLHSHYLFIPKEKMLSVTSWHGKVKLHQDIKKARDKNFLTFFPLLLFVRLCILWVYVLICFLFFLLVHQFTKPILFQLRWEWDVEKKSRRDKQQEENITPPDNIRKNIQFPSFQDVQKAIIIITSKEIEKDCGWGHTTNIICLRCSLRKLCGGLGTKIDIYLVFFQGKGKMTTDMLSILSFCFVAPKKYSIKFSWLLSSFWMLKRKYFLSTTTPPPTTNGGVSGQLPNFNADG